MNRFLRLLRFGPTMASLAISIGLFVGFPVTARAGLTPLSNQQLSAITGSGFSQLTVTGDTIRADFNITAETYADIASLKMGHWDNGTGTGWDQNWTNVKLGTASQDISMHGFYIQATFDNLSDPASRRLTGVFIGFNQVTGDLQANFESLSRVAATGGTDDQRANLGTQTFQFNNSGLEFSLELTGAHKGIWVHFGDGTTGP